MRITFQKAKSALHRRIDATWHIFLSPELPFLTKLQFLSHGFGQHSRRVDSYKLGFKEGELFLSPANYETDRAVVWDIFIRRCYKTEFGNSTVIDIGAHKGYFGAYALMHGADRVFSYEPERENFGLLNETARSFMSLSSKWETRRAAVAASTGEAELRVDPESWAHSLSSLPSSALTERMATQVVQCTAMTDVLESTTQSSVGRRLIVKIDAEGAECEIVLKTPVEAWQIVDEVLIEVHDFASCSSAEIADHLGRAGLAFVSDRWAVLHMRRPSDS